MKKVLVLGASGYIGSQLLAKLCDKGYAVTAAARQVDYLSARTIPRPNLELCYLDLADAEATQALVCQFDLVYFLVHGMAQGHDFIEYEVSLAENFKAALERSHVQQVIYLSAIQPQTGNSEHLLARKMTGDILRKSGVPIIEIRAGVIIGPGSAAFEIMRDFVYNLPVLITPKWVDSQANPIALENINYYLLQLAENLSDEHQIYEAGGPDLLSYREQFKVICQASHQPYRLYATSLLTPKMASYWLGMVTSVPASIGSALLAGLEHDFIADSSQLEARFPQAMISFEAMVTTSIEQEGKFVRSNVWGFDPAALNRWQAGYGYYPKQTGASIETKLSAEQLWQVVKTLGNPKDPYFFANALWRTREWLDIFFGGGKPIRRSPEGPELKVGDYIDSWKVIRCEQDQFLSLLFGMQGPGLGRLEFSITDQGDTRLLNITAWWHPQGFKGLLYWFAMMPAHLFIFKGMVKAIVRKAKANTHNSKEPK
ncbi:hypothetical protein VII00023_03268 [Vibrio ichthyoenteri ATCC 700023]|uniref:NAD(P)-binding domain-containing protein n=1 Tax=Vibrio ichthyoenteri ATCC 700023 TaxID=870968 RepID=F9RYL8_9VIBR|nr:DUF2867 domain-containing protein [Vibrio ichthyoenteri]EGU46435.1 hypothetical protein VII00023_03268 [Vibrio ichthyoenteri ATCC 700023]